MVARYGRRRTTGLCVIGLITLITIQAQERQECPLVIMIPTGDGRLVDGQVGGYSGDTFTEENLAKEGYALLAGALLAINHFNERNPLVVQELSSIGDCLITFPPEQLQIVNSNRNVDSTLALFLLNPEPEPCAIVGPEDSLAAEVAGSAATLLDITTVTFGGMDEVITNPTVYPHMARSTSMLTVFVEPLIRYLAGREYLAVVYGPNHFDTQLLEPLIDAAEHEGMTLSTAYIDVIHHDPLEEIQEALKSVYMSGYRTILLTLTRDDNLEMIAEEADKLGMLANDYLWVLMDETLQPNYIRSLKMARDSPLLKLLSGSAIYGKLDGFEWNPDDRFLPAWRSLDSTFVDQVNELYPSSDYVFQGEADYFQTNQPGHQTSFVYDTVLSIGLGVCQAIQNANDQKNGDDCCSNVSLGDAEFAAILESDFKGASGRMRFNDRRSRNAQDISFGIFNLVHNNIVKQLVTVLMSRFDGENDEWVQLVEFVYPDGTTNDPTPNRFIFNNNYLGEHVRATGLTCMTLSMIFTLFSAIVTYIHRKERIIKASQPEFLYLLFFGAFTLSSSILLFSFDESHGWTTKQLSRACMATPWLLYIGYLIIYLALFSKLWRIRKVLQFRRTQVKWIQVLGPFAFFMVTTIVLLVVWATMYPWKWERQVISEEPPETAGACRSDEGIVIACVLSFIVFVATLITGYMAHKTRDIPGDFSDSQQVWYTIFCHIQSLVVGLPVVVILNGTSPDVYYLGLSLLITMIASSSVAFIMVPKLSKIYRKAVRRESSDEGTRTRIHITGLSRRKRSRGASATTRNPFAVSHTRSSHAHNLDHSLANAPSNSSMLHRMRMRFGHATPQDRSGARTSTARETPVTPSASVSRRAIIEVSEIPSQQEAVFEVSELPVLSQQEVVSELPSQFESIMVDRVVELEERIRLLEEEKAVLLENEQKRSSNPRSRSICIGLIDNEQRISPRGSDGFNQSRIDEDEEQ